MQKLRARLFITRAGFQTLDQISLFGLTSDFMTFVSYVRLSVVLSNAIISSVKMGHKYGLPCFGYITE